MGKIQVRTLRKIGIAGKHYEEGAVVELDKKFGEALIQRGYVEAVKE